MIQRIPASQPRSFQSSSPRREHLSHETERVAFWSYSGCASSRHLSGCVLVCQSDLLEPVLVAIEQGSRQPQFTVIPLAVFDVSLHDGSLGRRPLRFIDLALSVRCRT